MTNYIRKFVAVAWFAVALSGAAFAQDMPKETVRANVPFDFYAGDQKLPAGVYTLVVSVDRRITLRNQETGSTYFLQSKPGDGVSDTRHSLTFDVVGSTYLLHSLQDNSVSVSFFESRPLLATASNRSTVTIATGK